MNAPTWKELAKALALAISEATEALSLIGEPCTFQFGTDDIDLAD